MTLIEAQLEALERLVCLVGSEAETAKFLGMSRFGFSLWLRQLRNGRPLRRHRYLAIQGALSRLHGPQGFLPPAPEAVD